MNAIDSLLQTSFPSVMVPMRESVVALDRPGERLLIAADGVYLEVVRSWIRVVRRIAKYDVATAIPYGRVDAVTQQLCGPVPPQLIAEFRAMARISLMPGPDPMRARTGRAGRLGRGSQ